MRTVQSTEDRLHSDIWLDAINESIFKFSTIDFDSGTQQWTPTHITLFPDSNYLLSEICKCIMTIVVHRGIMNNEDFSQSTKSGKWYIQWDNYRPNQFDGLYKLQFYWIHKCKHNKSYAQLIYRGWKTISKFDASVLSQWIA